MADKRDLPPDAFDSGISRDRFHQSLIEMGFVSVPERRTVMSTNPGMFATRTEALRWLLPVILVGIALWGTITGVAVWGTITVLAVWGM